VEYEKEHPEAVQHNMGAAVQKIEGTLDDPQLAGVNVLNNVDPVGTDKVIRKAEKQAEKSMRHGASEEDVPDRSISAVRSPDERSELVTLPVIGEAAESGSANSASMTPQRSKESLRGRNSTAQPAYPALLNNNQVQRQSPGEMPPPTPPKSDGTASNGTFEKVRVHSRPPPTPPKDNDSDHSGLQGLSLEKTLSDPSRISRSSLDKALPPAPQPQPSSVPHARISQDEMESLRARIANLSS